MKRKLWMVAGALVVSAGVYACIGSMIESVHFNSTQPDFGSPPPPIVITSWGETQERIGATQQGAFESDYKEQPYDEAAEKKRKDDHRVALQLESNGDFPGAIKAYEAFLQGHDEPDAEEIRDRIEVMQEAKTPSPLVMSYLSAQRTSTQTALDSTEPNGPNEDAVKAARTAARQQYKQIAADPVAGFLKAHAFYASATLDYTDRNMKSAADLYQQAAEQAGPRKERALIMVARSLLFQGAVPDGKTWEDEAAPDPANLAKAQQAIDNYLAAFPQGRYAADAKGLNARVLYLQKRYPEALSLYLRQLTETKKPEKQATVLASIQATLHHSSAAQAKEIQAMIMREPSLLEPYLDYRLYHTEAKPEDMKSLVAFANQVRTSGNAPGLSGAILARIAEIKLLTGDRVGAQADAEASLAAPGTGRKDLAHYVLATCYAKAGNPGKATAEYEEVMKDQDSYLAAPAKENLALAYERAGQWNKALDTYWSIGYTNDVAFLLDIRMSPAEIQSVIDVRGASDEHHDLMVYSLGMRYLRMDQLDKAKSLLASLSAAKRAALSKKGSRDYAWVDADSKSATVDSLFDPLDTANDLMKLKSAVSSATSPNQKAQAMYSLATYYYTHRNLMLYNAALWEGGRNWMLGSSWNDKVATPADTAAVNAHHFEHEALYHARTICLSLVSAYPHAPVAAKALYRAATATRRLASFNEWWRLHNKSQDMYKSAASLLDQLVAKYPSDPLAKNAKKYGKVFREEGKGAEQYQMFSD